jgi:hypothetical protein
MTWSRVKQRSQVHDAAHDKARAAAAAMHHPSDPCVRCGRPLGPMGPALHYDHHDTDKTRYLGFSHRACNLRAAGQLGRARQKAARQASQATWLGIPDREW